MIATILRRLEAERNPEALAGMAQYGITPARAYGVRIPVLHQLAREVRSKDKAANHALAQQLWSIDLRPSFPLIEREAGDSRNKELRGTAVQNRLKR